MLTIIFISISGLVLLLVVLFKNKKNVKFIVPISEPVEGHSYSGNYIPGKNFGERSKTQSNPKTYDKSAYPQPSTVDFDPTDMLNPFNPLSPLWVAEFLRSDDQNYQTDQNQSDVQSDFQFGGGQSGGAGAGGEFDTNDKNDQNYQQNEDSYDDSSSQESDDSSSSYDDSSSNND